MVTDYFEGDLAGLMKLTVGAGSSEQDAGSELPEAGAPTDAGGFKEGGSADAGASVPPPPPGCGN